MRERFSGNFLMLVVSLGVVFILCQAMGVSGAGKTEVVIGGTTAPDRQPSPPQANGWRQGYQFWADELNAKGGC